MSSLPRSKELRNHFQAWNDSNCGSFWMMTGWVVVSRSTADWVGGPGQEQQCDPYTSTSRWLKSPIAGQPAPRGREHRAITAPLSRACSRWWLTVKYSHFPKEKVRPICLQSSLYIFFLICRREIKSKSGAMFARGSLMTKRDSCRWTQNK